jgi:hypothetical protein
MNHHHRHQLTTAHCWPLQLLALSLDLRLLASCRSSSRQPSCVKYHSTWPEGVLHYVYRDAVSTPELVYPAVVGSTADMASLLPRQHANTVCYIGDMLIQCAISVTLVLCRITITDQYMNRYT